MYRLPLLQEKAYVLQLRNSHDTVHVYYSWFI